MSTPFRQRLVRVALVLTALSLTALTLFCAPERSGDAANNTDRYAVVYTQHNIAGTVSIRLVRDRLTGTCLVITNGVNVAVVPTADCEQ